MSKLSDHSWEMELLLSTTLHGKVRAVFHAPSVRSTTAHFPHSQLADSSFLTRLTSESSQAQTIMDLQPPFFLLTFDVTTAAPLGAFISSLQKEEDHIELQSAKGF